MGHVAEGPKARGNNGSGGKRTAPPEETKQKTPIEDFLEKTRAHQDTREPGSPIRSQVDENPFLLISLKAAESSHEDWDKNERARKQLTEVQELETKKPQAVHPRKGLETPGPKYDKGNAGQLTE